MILVRFNHILAAFLLFVALEGCGDRSTGGDANVDAGTTDATTEVATGDVPINDAPDGACLSDAQCDDHIACTLDRCETGVCSHSPESTRCPAGQACSARGCMPSRPCATDRDCADTDPCTVRESCDPAARVCVSGRLDGDGDGHPALNCGGDDCDDGNPLVHPGAVEGCDSRDDNCNGMVDDGATCGPGEVCQRGGCSCRSWCGGGCVDLTTDRSNCGTCGNACLTESTCVGGRCTCAMAYPDLCGGACTALQRDPANCGTCGRACSMLPELLREFDRLCTAGRCQCPPDTNTCMVAGQPMCTLFASDPMNCGRCGNVCPAPANGTAMCEAGACGFRCNSGFYRRGDACVGFACMGWAPLFGCDPINNVRCPDGARCAVFAGSIGRSPSYQCVEGASETRAENESCTEREGCMAGLVCYLGGSGDSGFCARPCCGPTDTRCGTRECRGGFPGGPPYGHFCADPL